MKENIKFGLIGLISLNWVCNCFNFELEQAPQERNINQCKNVFTSKWCKVSTEAA